MSWTLAFEAIKFLVSKLVASPQEKAEALERLQELEIKAREAEAKIEVAREESFARFVESTQPKSADSYRWVNSLIALVRPGLAVFVMLSLVFATEKWTQVLGALADAGIWGAIAISPLIVWVLGRDGLRLILGYVSMKTGHPIPPDTLPVGTQSVVPMAPVRPVVPTASVAPVPSVRPSVWIPPDLPPVLGDNRNDLPNG